MEPRHSGRDCPCVPPIKSPVQPLPGRKRKTAVIKNKAHVASATEVSGSTDESAVDNSNVGNKGDGCIGSNKGKIGDNGNDGDSINNGDSSNDSDIGDGGKYGNDGNNNNNGNAGNRRNNCNDGNDSKDGNGGSDGNEVNDSNKDDGVKGNNIDNDNDIVKMVMRDLFVLQ